MFSKIRRRCTYANVAATLALVFAMSSGAYAAGRYVITSAKQVKPSVLAQLKGRTGADGAPGATGAVGPAGAVGPQGAKGETGPGGAEGKEGKAGGEGKAGVSVTGKEVAKGGCSNKEGGSEFTAGSTKTFACNGKEGSPWAAGGTLPKGSEEKGVWTDFGSKEGEVRREAISFEIPLKTRPQVEFVAGAATANCPGSAESPTAKEGYLCVYDVLATTFPEMVSVKASFVANDGFEDGSAAGTTGTQATWTTEFSTAFKETGETGAFDRGTWAVTGD